MSFDVGEVTERLENELCSFSKLLVTSPTSQLIPQPFPRFTYVTTHSPTLPLLHLRHSSFSNPFASPTSQDFHLRHLASRPWRELISGSDTYFFGDTRTWRAFSDEGSVQCRSHLRDSTNMKDDTHQAETHSFQQGEYEMVIMAAK